jgi:hypothetical protein
LPEHFKIKVTTVEESKDLEEMKIEELVESLQTYEYSLPPVKKARRCNGNAGLELWETNEE